MDDDPDDKDDTKRKSRNLSEKKRRDQFNTLINELNSMVSNTSRKMDKSTVLKSAISFLRNQNEMSVRSREHEIQEDWKPSFLTNEEFTHIILESIDGFIVVFSLSGHILYTSGSVTSLLGYLPSDLMNNQMSLMELVCEEDHQLIYDVLSGSRNGNNSEKDNPVEISLRMRRGPPDVTSDPVYELVNLVGYFRGEKELPEQDNMVSSTNLNTHDSGLVFVGTGRLMQSYPIGEVTFACEATRSEFSSRHNLDWKFLALDSRATPIIGYVQIEVVGTSGYDYYHVDDLDNIVACHESLMEKGEGTSCYYRFLTKGQQWVWLQTRYYISYHQWNAKPEFVVCSHRVISYVDVMLESRKPIRDIDDSQDDLSDATHYDARSQMRREAPLPELSSDSASLSEDSHFSRASISTMGRHSRRDLRSPRSHMSRRRRCLPPTSPTDSRASRPSYLKAAPLQPLLPAYPVSPVRHPQAAAQRTPMPDEVKKKQQELDQLRQLMSQKEEELQQYVNAQSAYSYPPLPSLLNLSAGYPGVVEPRQLIALVPVGPAAAPVTQEYLVQSTSADPPTSQGSVHSVGDEGNHSFDETRHRDSIFNSPPPPPRH